MADDDRSSHVRLLLTDISGQRRTRVVPASRFHHLIKHQGVGITQCCMGMTSFSDAPAPGCGLGPVGEVRLIPDETTLTALPWFPSHSLVMVDAHTSPGTPWSLCPRSTLNRLAAQLRAEFNLVLRAGFESEFFLLKSIEPHPVPVDLTPYCSSSAMDSQAQLLTDISNALQAMGIEVEQLHPEAGGGQYEISIGHSADVAAADQIILVREAVAAVAKRAHPPLHATFLPQVFPNNVGSGSHCHVSIWEPISSESATGGATLQENGVTYRNAFTAHGSQEESDSDAGNQQQQQQQHGMSVVGQRFLAGVLAHLPAILAISSPLPNSYDRLQPNKWAGPFQCWGRENREAGIRLSAPPCTPSPSSAQAETSAPGTEAAGACPPAVTNFEIKACDAAGNPYLILASIIAAGLDGLRNEMKLREPVEENPAALPSSEQPPRLPSSLSEAAAALKNNTVMKEALGHELVQTIVAVREAEVQHYLSKPFEESVATLIYRY